MEKEIKVIIGVVDNATAWMKKIGSKISSFAEKNKENFEGMRNVGAVAFAGIAYSAKEMIDSFSEAQAAMVKVDGILKTLWNETIKNAGGSLDSLKKSIEDVSAANVKLGFDDEDTATSLAKLTAATWDYTKANELNNLAMDLARYKGIWLAEASETLIKVQSGQTRVLKELGIEVKEGTTAAEAFAIVQQKTAWQAEAYSKTIAGQNEIMAVSFGNLKESIGEALAPAFGKIVEAIQPMIQKFSERASANPELLAKVVMLAWGLAWLLTVIGTIWVVIPSITAWFLAISSAVSTLYAWLLLLWAWPAILLAIAAALIYFTSGGPTESIAETETQMKALNESFKAGNVSADEYKKQMWALQTKMGELSAESQTTTGQIKDAFDLLLQDTAQAIFDFGEKMKQIRTDLKQWFDDFMNALAWLLIDSWNAIKTGVFVIIDSFTAWVRSKLQGIMDFATGAIRTITAIVNSAWELAGKIGNGVSSAVSSVGNAISGKRALWGTVMAWKAYLVGENWPEVITPNTTSNVGQVGWKSMSVNINLGGVVINNSQDEVRLVQMVKNAFIEEVRYFNLWIIA